MTGYTIDKETELVWVKKLSKFKEVEINESSPELINAIDICFKESILKCEEEKKNPAINEEYKNMKYQSHCAAPNPKSLYGNQYGAHRYRSSVMYKLDNGKVRYLPHPAEFFWVCMKERNYYEKAKVLSSQMRCKTIYGK